MQTQLRRRNRQPWLPVFACIVSIALLVAGLIRWGDWHRDSRSPPTSRASDTHSAPPPAESTSEPTAAAAPTSRQPAENELAEQRYARLREEMVAQQLAGRGIRDHRVLDAMRRVPRHQFVPQGLRDLAYADRPLPIGHRQTISQPLIVAEMTQLVRTRPEAKALDVGTGSGYQAAVLAELVDHVYSIEILQPLADEARERLETLGYENVTVRCGDGYRGWPEAAPFDLIIVAAAPDHVPQPLVQQLAPGGRLVLPVGESALQNLVVVEKRLDGTTHRRYVVGVSFVPMTGEAEQPSDR